MTPARGMATFHCCWSGWKPIPRVLASCLVFGLCAGRWSCGWAEDVRTTVVVDTARAGAPLNPYLYGQFIEHAGRCIHDGIWAEMLQDRKFSWEPGRAWQRIGPEGADFEVRHDPAGA